MNNRIIIDGGRIGSREELFVQLRSQLQQQTGISDILSGSNLDALHDALTSITTYTVIEIHSETQLSAMLGDYWKRVLWVINDCLDENDNLALEMH
ncbi:MAG: barstar family protein [Firmicutes bacterium]|nr:barstar family protein [Bacillota bacterium]